ncbi:MAG: WYL domain-containing transcriptional regulator [Planctomycetota bacterium]|nr:WYL domain-containing transcriptional regulator [Planctomycetota bacterium]
MDRNRSQTVRVARLSQAIRRRTYPNCRTFAEDHEVSRRTVLRDLDYLRQMGAPLEFDYAHNGFVYTDATWQFPAIDLNSGELLQLLLAERMAAQYKGLPVARTLGILFKKVSAALPEGVSLDPAYLSEQFSFHAPPSRPVSERVWDVIFKGLRGSRILKIEYARPDWKSPQERTIEPIHVASLGGEWYLVARRRGEARLRHFALSRIRSAELSSEAFEPPEFHPDEYFKDRFSRFVDRKGRTHQVAVRVTKATAPWALEREWHSKQKITRGKDGSATLSFPAPSLEEVRRWVLQWGADAEVLRPPELRRMVAKEVMAMRRAYRR